MSVAAADDLPRTATEFRVGSVIARSVRLLSRAPVPFIALTSIGLVPSIVRSLFGLGPADPWYWISAWGATLVSIFLGAIANAVIIQGAFQLLRGRAFRMADSVSAGLARLWPVLGLSTVLFVAYFVGAILLVVPYLILTCRWYVALPACVVDRAGPLTSMKRSAGLTRGVRWKILGIHLLVFIVLYLVAGQGVRYLVLLVGGPLMSLIAGSAWLAVFSTLHSITVVVTYHDLRVAQEGVDIDQIAAVFD